MEKEKNRRLDEAALRRLLEREQTGPEALVLRLAWLEGLTREEIASLTWNQVSFLDDRLELPDRMIPLDGEVRALLWKLHEAKEAREEPGDPHVLLSARERKPMRLESISRLARLALDRGGLKDVRLLDLRYDWIIRCLDRMDWPEAARISGVEVATLQLRFSASAPARKAPKPPPVQVDEFKLWKVLQAERETAAGLAMWLGWQLGLQAQEMIALTWDQVDFEEGLLRLPDREVVLTSAVRRLLEEERQRRKPGEDAHVLLTERSRKPLDLPRLSRLTRTALIRGGLERATLRDLKRDDGRDAEDEQVLQRVLEQGFVSRGDVSDLLGLSKTATYARLRRLTELGKLVRVGGKYYLPGTVIPPEQHREAILGYLAQAGFAYRQDIVDLLHIQPKQCTLVLHHMVEEGVLVQLGQKYFLPQKEERKVE
nr:crosslink repair DNA glycosylase YcaQ family protein [uncultured Oscillibacter sp.]